jgi:superfamily II DNA/RNA helicase
MTSFADLGVEPDLVDALADAGILEPFPVQTATIPDGLAGKDVCCKAPTGSGKTFAFGLPILQMVPDARSKRPRAMILAPTRELAEQIANELIPLGKAIGRSVAIVYGGVAYGPQKSALEQGAEILVATPGRLADLIEQGSADLSDVEYVVIDEADRMADMGFLHQVRWLLNQTARDRQTMLFSATLDGDAAVLSHHYQTNPVQHEAESPETESSDATHHFWRVEYTDRLDTVADVIEEAHPTIVFCNTRSGVDRLARQLSKRNVRVDSIHGGRSQRERNKALEQFTDGKVDALIATDVAARGIHVDDVACVVHWDPSEDHKAYLHRSGRTGRAGASGVVVSIVQPNLTLSVHSLQRNLGLEVGLTEPDLDDLTSGGGQLVDQTAKPTPRTRSSRRRRLL